MQSCHKPVKPNGVFLSTLFAAVLGSSSAGADTIGSVQTRTWNEASIQVYAINVSSGDYPKESPYALTSDEVDALVASGLPLWKEGTGSVSAGTEMSSFDGDIYVVDGIYKVTALGALGTTAGATYVDGGTIEGGYTGAWSWDPPDATFGMESLFVAGEGVDGLGAIYASSQAYKLFGGTLTLTGDTLLTGDNDVSMRCSGSTFNGGGRTLTVAMNKGKNMEVMNGTMTNLLALVLTKGNMSFAHGLSYKTLPGATVTIKAGTAFKFDGFKCVPCTLVLEDGARLLSGTAADRNNMYSAGNLPGVDKGAGSATNVWAGPVVIQGAVTNMITKGREITISGPVSGPGRFVGGDGGYIRLVNAGNAFTGPTAAKGVVENSATVGGLELMNTNAVAFVQPNPIAVTNASLGAFSQTSAAMSMGDLAFHGQASLIGNSHPCSATTASSLLKTGAGTLTISRPVAISGATEIREGTLKFECPCGGLEYWTYVPYVAGPDETTDASHGSSLNIGTYGTRAKAYQALSNNYTRVGVDPAGARMSFVRWKGNELVFSHHAYAGEIFVPGDEPATWNFASRFQRCAWIEIDGETVFDLRDISLYGPDGNKIRETTYSTRMAVGDPMTINPGWHEIFIAIGNNWGHYNYEGIGPYGSYNVSGIYWDAYLGIALNKSGTCTSNSADYVALKDPGDGSFLRISKAQRQSLSPSTYRPVFNGPVTFGTGTVFDIGDSAPYVPVSVTDTFTGCPELQNGILELSGEWVLDEAAIAADQPLRATGGAGISFAEGASLTLPDDTALRALLNKPLLYADSSSSISGRDNLVITSPGNARAVWSDDGKTLTLAKRSGFVLIVR